MTRQEIFNLAYASILRQGKASMHSDISMSSGFVCAYRGENGSKCNFGAVIPDEMYKYGMECLPADAVLLSYPELRIYLGLTLAGSDMRFANSLQACHDTAGLVDCKPTSNEEFIRRYKKNMADFAKHYNLEVPA